MLFCFHSIQLLFCHIGNLFYFINFLHYVQLRFIIFCSYSFLLLLYSLLFLFNSTVSVQLYSFYILFLYSTVYILICSVLLILLCSYAPILSGSTQIDSIPFKLYIALLPCYSDSILFCYCSVKFLLIFSIMFN